MLKGNMGQHEDGFTAVEILVTLLVAGTFMLAFVQLFGATTNIATITKEESAGVNKLMEINDENRYNAASKNTGATLQTGVPYMRGATGASSPYWVIIKQEVGVDITPTLKRKDVSITYNGNRVMKSSTFIRYEGGIFYDN